MILSILEVCELGKVLVKMCFGSVQIIHFVQTKDYVKWLFLCCCALFSNRSQMTSKCGNNKKVAHKVIAECVTVSYHILRSSVIYS